MDTNRFIAEIDIEIARLQRIRAALAESNPEVTNTTRTVRGRGRPKGSKNLSTKAAAGEKKATVKKRGLSPEGQKKIAEAMKRRWAERRKNAEVNSDG